ncbi:MAG: hypothetical protein WC845_00940 [Candidatus Staskawiczbacteria bacterium]|jgi:hypothetical protein
MSISKERIDDFKEIFKKEYGKELTDAEAYESAHNLLGFVQVLYDIHRKEVQRKYRLRKEPQGFNLTDGIYDCSICRQQQPEGQIWYDKWGITCSTCRKAVQTGVVPSFICNQRHSWYPMWQIESNFGIKWQRARKMAREGTLKAKIVPAENGNPYEYIFLKKENPELVDPDRSNPCRKSWDRNQNKIAKAKTKEARKKAFAEWEAEQKRIKKLKNKNRF